jgi:hypothetical protein
MLSLLVIIIPVVGGIGSGSIDAPMAVMSAG